MSGPAPKPPRTPASLADLLALPDEGRGYEIINGELVEKETTAEHGGAQFRFGALLSPYARRSGGPPDRPGGWWFATEVLIDFGEAHKVRPDVAGWGRERSPARPTGTILTLRPDWICEILSPGRPGHDTITKKRVYHRHQVPHYWILDPMRETLMVYRWTLEGYLEVLAAERSETVRAEPFDAIRLPVGVFFGDDEEDRP